jgi:hypothetical protein
MQGMGVNAPIAAAEAAATIGFAMLLHVPKGGIFNTGAWAMILAAGISTITGVIGKTCKVDGAVPNEHMRTALLVTKNPIVLLLCRILLAAV